MTLRAIIADLLADRVIQAGTGTTAVSGLGAAGLAIHPLETATLLITQLQPWVAFFAALMGGILSVTLIVYTCLKIRRLLQNPAAKD